MPGRDGNDYESPADRLRRAREAAGYQTAKEFSDALGIAEGTYRHHDNGNRGFKLRSAQKYARKLGVDPYWLLTGRLPKGAAGSTVPVVGYLGAGAAVLGVDRALGEVAAEVPAPPETTGNEVAIVVRGDAMYPAYRDGDILYYREQADSEDNILGVDCVVMLADESMVVKLVNRGSRLGTYTLVSHNAPPMNDQVIRWATPVLWVRKARKTN